ncbi:MAG: TonB-dependent receptor [Gemmatirosa sp.]|nr:TonB-dependent receptor [Gemmatirosa sp.]
MARSTPHRPRHLPRAALALAAVLPLGAATSARAQELAARRAAYVVQFSAAKPDVEAAPGVLRQPITLQLHRVPLERALRELTARTGLSISYSRAVVPLDRVVSVDVTDGSALDALFQMLRDARVELWISAEGRMALVPETPARRQPGVQAGTITGRVTQAESGVPVASATVSIAGTTLGTLTNAEGRYTIGGVAPGARVVRVQRIGYAPDSTTLSVSAGSNTADFALRVTAVQLSTVVAIGYGTTSRAELTGAVASVTSEQIAAQPVQSVNEVLQGRAPGVEVVTQSGQPGAGAMVRIRGGNSISAGNNPLYVIDGVPIVAAAAGANTNTLMTQGQGGLNPIATLNPDDIESIDVLKDASSAAIYGARAANGVVLITTKRGRAGKNTSSLGAYFGQQEVRHTLPVLNATQFATFVNSAYTNAGQTAPFSSAQVASLGTGTNWQDEIFRRASVRNYEGSFSGGSQDTKYYISGNLLQDDGVVIGTNLDRGTFRMNLDQTISSRFRIGTRLTGSRSDGNILPNGGAGQEVSSVVLNAILAPPTLPVKTSSGEYFTGDNPLTGRPFANPVASALEITNREQQSRGIGNVYAEYDLVPGLVLRSTAGADYLSSTQDFYSPATTLPGRNNNGQGSRGTQQTTTWQNENTLSYSHGFGQTNLDLLGGVTFQRMNSQNISGTAQNFLTDRLREDGLNSAGTFVGVYTGSPHSSLLSYFSRANAGFRDKYLLTVTGRVDGSSRFGEGNQYAFFPSAALAWRISKEAPIERLGWFDDLKLRVSAGRTGNQDIGNYASLATLGSTVYVFGGQRATGYVPSSLANPDLKWETTAQTDVGLDVSVLNNRVSITADAYDKKTSDLLLYVPVPRVSGFDNSLQNVGSVRNRGLELALNTTNLSGAFGGRFGWTTTLNLAWNRNKVLNLGPDSQIVAPEGVGAGANQNPTILKIGQPINAFYGWTYAGLDANGQPTYADLNGDGNVTEADRSIIGSAQPNYTGGFTNRFSYGGLSLSVFLQFSVGNKIYNINRALLTSAAGNANQLVDVLNAGTGSVPKPKVGNTFDTRPSTLFVEDGTYLRGKNIRLDYTIPPRLLRAGHVGRLESLQVYASAQNFFTSTKYSGFDPEISEYAGTNLAQGFDFGTYPQARQITFGFTTSF